MSLLPSRYGPGAFLAFLCIAALVLVGCGAGCEAPQLATAGLRTLPHAMKGYELYSWQVGGEWRFTLITGTNRLKSHNEIVSTENVITETDWVKLSAQGVKNLRAVLDRLPESETVTWSSGRWLEGASVPKGTIQLPDAELLGEIEGYCRRLGIQLQIAH
jgi:hypothetical protein